LLKGLGSGGDGGIDVAGAGREIWMIMS